MPSESHALPHAPRNRRLLWGAALLAVAAIATLLFFATEHDWPAFYRDTIARIERLPLLLVIPLLAVLPLGGFSIAIVYLIAGLRFGPVWGGVFVAVITVFHLCVTHAIARGVLQDPLNRFLRRKHYRWPEIAVRDQPAVAAVAALMPGIPYAVRNVLLALSGMPLRVYLPISALIYVVRSYVTILLGDVGGDLSLQRLLILGAVLAVKLSICALILRHLKRHHAVRFTTPA